MRKRERISLFPVKNTEENNNSGKKGKRKINFLGIIKIGIFVSDDIRGKLEEICFFLLFFRQKICEKNFNSEQRKRGKMKMKT